MVKSTDPETKKQRLKRALSQKALKPGMITALHGWRFDQLRLINLKEERIIRLLFNSAPPELADFLSNREYLIINLVRNCDERQKTGVTFSDLWHIFGLSQTSFLKNIRLLKRAWKGVIKISVEKVEAPKRKGCFEIIFETI